MQSPASDIIADPFDERRKMLTTAPMQLLGAKVTFETNSRALLRLVGDAFAGLPAHRLPGRVPSLSVRLLLAPHVPGVGKIDPEPMSMFCGFGLLGGATGASNVVILSPRQRCALIRVSPDMLRSEYHARYELIEFALYALAARSQGLVPLHAACVAHQRRAVLIMGPSGAGKSTVALHCALAGMDFLSEDSVFVAAKTLQATGVANFLHVRADSLGWFGRSPIGAMIRRSPIIRRRSGARKFEVNLRRKPFLLAPAPPTIVASVFLSSTEAGKRPMLRPLSDARLKDRLAAEQAYGTNQIHWPLFARRLSQLPAFELRRGRHPDDSVAAIRSLLA